MSSGIHKFFTRLIVLLILIMLVRYWKIAEVIFSGHINNVNHLRIVALVVAYFGLNIVAVIGLFQLKAWRTVVAGSAILFSTLFFSTSYIPFIAEWFAKPYRFYAMIIANLIVLLAVICLRKHKAKR